MSLRSVVLGLALVSVAGAASAECTSEPRIQASRYEFQGSQVFDKETKLSWQRCAVGQKWQDGLGCVGTPQQLSWSEVQKLKGSWRLPTKEELATLISDACLRSVNAEAFPGISLLYPSYWTRSQTTSELTWTIDLNTGHEFNALQTSRNAAMLVQGQAIAQTPTTPKQQPAQ